MKVAFLMAPSAHFTPLMSALIDGATEAGDEPSKMLSPNGAVRLPGVGAAVVWGWRRGEQLRKLNPELPVLVMERGYVGDRFHWTSLGWNGLNGRAVFPKPPSTTAGMLRTLNTNMREDLKPWRLSSLGVADSKIGYALILGQVPSDMACRGVNLATEYRRWQSELLNQGWTVKFRPHPKAGRRPLGISSLHYVQGTLAQDLAGAAFTVSWNSNASVDSVLAGVPSVTLDRGAMAWGVTSHDLANPVTMPSRIEWAARLAWCQWQPSELADGSAWRAVKMVMPR